MRREARAAGQRTRGLAIALACLLLAVPARAQDGPVVFAAASLTDALRALGRDWVGQGRAAPRFSFAASSTLARQIEQGAPADLFMSADEAWADYLQSRGLLADATRISPLGNTLVLVAPSDTSGSVDLARGTDLARLLGARGRIATGDPAHVPVGRYAREALTWMGQWQAIGPRLARADSVRAALLLVERGEAPFAIVYATDAASSAGVRVAGRFPAGSHSAITYPFALTRRAAGDMTARAFLSWLTGPDARATWERFGFVVIP
jgi:molybdate transport system substrate-binding protein